MTAWLQDLLASGSEDEEPAPEKRPDDPIRIVLIEEMVLRAVAVGDVGVCSIPNADGIEEICVAVSRPPVGDEELLRRITDAFRGFQFGRFRVLKMPGIPRTATGKLQRKVLKDAVAQAIRQHAAR